MILSFFVFLVISCSMLFGMTSFIIGMKSQIPAESWNANKDFVNVSERQFSFEKNEKKQYSFSAEMRTSSQESFTNLLRKTGINNPGNDTESTVKAIVNNGGIIDNKITKFDDVSIKKMNDQMYEEIGYANFTDYYLETEIFGKHKLDIKDGAETIKPRIWAGAGAPAFTEHGGYGKGITYIINNKDRKYIESEGDNGFYEYKQYKNQANVIFTNNDTKKRVNWKVGSTVDFSNGKDSYKFVYGGVFAPNNQKIYSESGKNSYYYLANLTNDNPFSYQKSPSNYASTWFKIYYSKIPQGIKFTDYINEDSSSFQKIFNGHVPSDEITSRFNTAYTLYNAFFLLTIVFIFILVILDVILAWFLIKQIIDNLASQLLFLKAMGLKDSEASLINALSISIMLILGIGLGLVGMLGVQALFTNMITNFIDIILPWNVIQPMSLILVFGLLAFLFIVYFVSNYLLVSKLNLASNRVVKKSELWFPKFRSFLFGRNINSGITFSFTIKNMSKMFVAFFIVLLMTILTFTAAQFSTSMSQGVKKIEDFDKHQDTYSYLKTSAYSKAPFTNKISPDIEYKNMNQLDDKENEITDIEPAIKNPVMPLTQWKGKWVSRKTLDQHKNEIDKLADFEKYYDEQIKQIDPNADGNFTVNFGVMYSNGVYTDTSFGMKAKGSEGVLNNRLVVLNDNDSRTNKLFSKVKKEYTKDKFLPVVTSVANTSGNNSYKENELISDVHLNLDSKSKDDKNNPELPFEISATSTLIPDKSLFYVRKSDFMNYLKDHKDNKFVEYVLDHELPLNTYLGNGVPNVLSQIVYTRDMTMLSHPEDYFSKQLGLLFVKLLANSKKEVVTPLMNAFIVILVLGIILMITFIIFMNMTIMQENDNIIFIMKALGYSKKYILWRIISGYFISITVGYIGGILIAWGLLSLLNGAFLPILLTSISFYWTWPIILMIIAFVVVLSGITLAISSTKIHQRSLTKREE